MKKILDLIETKLAEELNPEKRIGELFDGLLMKALYNNQQVIIDKIMEFGIRFLKNSKQDLKWAAVKAAKKEREKNNFIVKGIKTLVSNALGVEETIREVVDILVESRVPNFINNQKEEVNDLFTAQLAAVEKKKVKEIGIDLSRAGLEDIVNRLLTRKTLIEKLERLLDRAIDSIMEVKLKNLLAVISVNELVDVIEVFDSEIDILKQKLAADPLEIKEVIGKEVFELLTNVIDELVLEEVSLRDLSKGMKEENIDKSVRKIVDTVKNSERFEENLTLFIDGFCAEVKYSPVNEVIDSNQLKEDITQFMAAVLNNSELKNGLECELEEVLESIITDLNDIFAAETREFILKLGVESVLDAVEPHFLELLTAVDTKEITEREINNMTAQEIEELFNSFAAKYFRRLKEYGFLAGGIGLIIELLLMIL